MIFKYLQGGPVIPPLVSYQPVTVTGGTQEATKASTKSGEDLTDKDLLTMLEKLDGLPSDIIALTSLLLNFYVNDPWATGTSNIATRYLSALGQMKIAKSNREMYDSALKNVTENGGLHEFAVTERGLLIGMNEEGDYQLMSIEDFNNSDYRPLTNADLLLLRAQNPEFANNSNLISVVSTGIGMTGISKLINDSIKSLGTSEYSKEGYTARELGKIINGILILELAISRGIVDEKVDSMSIDGLYKVGLITKDLAHQAEFALNYILLILPENAKTILKLKSDGTNNGVKTLITLLIASKSDTSTKFSIDLETSLNTDGSKKATASTKKDSDDLKASLPIQIQKGLGLKRDITVDNGSGIAMSINGRYHSQVKTPDGKPITNTSLEGMLSESGLQSIVKNMRNITFGDLKLDLALLAGITYNNTGVLKANLPVNEDGTVRLEILEDFEKAESEIELLENPTEQLKSEIFKKYNLDDLLLPDGTVNPSKVAPFLVTEGYTTSQNGIEESSYIYRMKDPSDQIFKLILDSLSVKRGSEYETIDIDEFTWYNPRDWFHWYDDIYKAAIYIPITNNVNAGAYGADLNLDYNEALQLEKQYLNFEKLNLLGVTSDSVL